MTTIKALFDERFEAWQIELPVDAVERREPGFLRQGNGSGSVRYAFGTNERGEYLEYYSFHRIGGDSHGRIYADGTYEGLDTLQTMYVSSGEPAEVQQRVDEMHERNRRLLEALDEAGLTSGGPVPNSFTINAYLTTDDRNLDD
jgi:hypothetical protein